MKQAAFEIYSDRQTHSGTGPLRPALPPVLRVTPSVTASEVAAVPAESRVTLHPLAGKAAPGALAAAIEQQIIALLDDKPALGETIEAAFRRKEHELGAVFAQLTVIEAIALRKRLEGMQPGDVLAGKFGSLIAVRRSRLLAFLGDARRRQAMTGARR